MRVRHRLTPFAILVDHHRGLKSTFNTIINEIVMIIPKAANGNATRLVNGMKKRFDAAFESEEVLNDLARGRPKAAIVQLGDDQHMA